MITRDLRPEQTQTHSVEKDIQTFNFLALSLLLYTFSARYVIFVISVCGRLGSATGSERVCCPRWRLRESYQRRPENNQTQQHNRSIFSVSGSSWQSIFKKNKEKRIIILLENVLEVFSTYFMLAETQQAAKKHEEEAGGELSL